MKVKQALDISRTMGYNVPVDMTDDILYWSETKKDTEKKIANGEYVLTDLNLTNRIKGL